MKHALLIVDSLDNLNLDIVGSHDENSSKIDNIPVLDILGIYRF